MAQRNTPSAADRQFARAERVVAKRWRQILARKGVTHVDVNYRTREGKRTEEVVIRVHVLKKLPRASLRPNQCFEKIDGVPVDVVESRNTYVPLSGPLRGGDKIAPRHQSADAGTLGIVCFSGTPPEPYFLTNAHVVYGGRKKSQLPARIPMVVPTGQHPTIGDGIRDKSFRNALVDCALIEPNSGQQHEAGLRGVDLLPNGFGKLGREDVLRQVKVRKVGAKTGDRQGIVDSVRLTFSTSGQGFLFQIGIKAVDGGLPFSAAGDSGSVVLRDRQIVGLLHGVTASGKIAVACHIDQVVKKLKIEI